MGVSTDFELYPRLLVFMATLWKRRLYCALPPFQLDFLELTPKSWT